jgi:hypothetical protein
MGRTKKRHRAWKQQMRARAKRKLEWYRNYGDISPGRLVAWAEWTEEDKPRDRERDYREKEEKEARNDA